ncbi:MAG: hypothetical protein HDS59_05110 [Barnesiella sp.]|nr:hypothetical protein [Barnesiella sp.]
MKFQATQWPVTIILDVADDYTEGIDKENLKAESPEELIQLQELANMLADILIKAKGQILAQQEAKRKQITQNNGTQS